MSKLLKLNKKVICAVFVITDLFCIGMGMGVPIFCILYGFFVGWYITRRVMISTKEIKILLGRIFRYAVVTSGFTFIVMAVLWGMTIPMLFDPNADFENFGHPYILYDPKLSFIGWLVLMIFISPFLQLLTTVFAAFVTLMLKIKEI